MSDSPPPKRVVVTSPRTRATAAPTRGAVDLRAPTTVTDVYLRSLMRTQLRHAVLVCGTVALVGLAIPLTFALAPSTRTMEVMGLRLVWLVLGALLAPLMVLGGWWYVRACERTENDFVALVQGPDESRG